ncbi:HD domain-containing protein [Arthrobacter bambusae]|uniref:(P)ppGpp synthase/HD superfamily hydrolase n=1 Tax=Arthrobacter bambusae TaxID=1338426 RepID=A0AAW8DBG5_9MICC|nr:HD domain-containing protein [Arthrobacter bambusae]MDP9903222.1 (p)ppGpp synthase/HD superfamily hydrolase [Arthrobacter bambusae]MDQ0128784.1 (p)ppGpp synthase/HD superfamily hydrolase [Arthrobacter bambusae]MDQ0180125.1 (p)ppGpp synthase/HD superfamily hydrolase [Arthrobacter bambusae]
MSALPTTFPRVPLKQMDAAALVFELDREAERLLGDHSTLITSAATVASFLHRNQTRFVRGDLPRVPYIEHPLRVALRLIRWGVTDAWLIAAALLHDVVEDCAEELVSFFGDPGDTPLECLTRMYGTEVATYVNAVTNPPTAKNKAGYLSHLQELAASGTAALLIKASDLKDNAGSIRHQIGHGQDARIFRMAAKYQPALQLVISGLEEHLVGRWSPAADSASADLGSVASELSRVRAMQLR